MVQSTSQRFLNAQAADVNQVSSQVLLKLGNYFRNPDYGTDITSNGDDASGNYPAIGAIDGDRTEINIGASTASDNNVGKSSWRSSVIPSPSTPATINLVMAQSRPINQIKIYHLSTAPLKSYQLTYVGGHLFAQTSDFAPVAGVTQIVTTGTLDVINFPTINVTQVMLSVYETVNGGAANVVEIEGYYLIDITNRVKNIKQTRQRDYKQINPMAATLQLDCINTDRFFSVSHVPTTIEIAAGFVNQQLVPGVQIIINMGFMYFGAAPEMVTVFTGEIDSITISPLTRDAVIQHRDVLKKIINKSADSSKLQTNIDISAAIQYVLNRANFSSYECALDTTGILLPVFFTDNEALLDTVRNLAQAAGDTIFYVDELGKPTFKDYSKNFPGGASYNSEIQWESGTLANVSTQGAYAGNLAVPPLFIPTIASGTLTGNMVSSGSGLSLTSSAAYTGDSFALGGGTMQQFETNVGSGGTTIGNTLAQPYNIPRAGTINNITLLGWEIASGQTVQIQVWGSSGGIPNASSVLYASSNFTGNQISGATVTPNLHVTAGLYFIVLQAGGTAQIVQAVAAVAASGRTAYTQYGTTWAFMTEFFAQTTGLGLSSDITFTYDNVSASGTWTSPWYDSGSLAVNPAPIVNNSGTYLSGNSETTYLNGSDDGSTVAVTYSTADLNGNWQPAVAQHRYWNLEISASATDNTNVPTIGVPTLLFGSSGTWTSDITDTGAATKGYGSITYDGPLNGGTITFYTRSSSDGISWTAWTATSMSDQILTTPVQRYLQAQAVITLGPGGVTPLIIDISAGWVTTSGSIKYPLTSSFTFQFDSQLLDVQQVLADNLGGDSSILNDIIVQAEPLVLTGATTDDPDGFTNVIWKGTVGTPPQDISTTYPLAVTAGQVLTFTPYISGGMDISFMSGSNPQCVNIVFAGGASGTWAITNIHPTLPVLQLTITGTGTITELELVGQTYENASYLQVQEVTSPSSIAQYEDRQLSITNPWVTSTTAALALANILLNNYESPVAYIPSAKVRLCPSIQLGDRVTIVDSNLDLSADYIVVGNNHNLTIQKKNATIETELVLMAIPPGH